MEIVVNSIEENNQTISEFEIKLAQFSDLPNDVELLKDVSYCTFLGLGTVLSGPGYPAEDKY